MAKVISNKKYDEFWNKDEFGIDKKETTSDKKISTDDIVKEVRKEVRKEIKKKTEELAGTITKTEEKLKDTDPLTENEKIDNPIIVDEQEKIDKRQTKRNRKGVEKKLSIETIPVYENDDIDGDKTKKIGDKNIQLAKNKIKTNILKKINSAKTETPSNINKSIKDIFEDISKSGNNYKIYINNTLLFDNLKHNDHPIFNDDHIVLYKRNYGYRGMRFEVY